MTTGRGKAEMRHATRVERSHSYLPRSGNEHLKQKGAEVDDLRPFLFQISQESTQRKETTRKRRPSTLLASERLLDLVPSGS